MSANRHAGTTPTQCPTSRHGAMLPTWSVSCQRHSADMSACLSFWGGEITNTTPKFPAKETIPLQSIPHPANTQSRTHERDRSALLDWCFEMAAFLTMGFANIHRTQKRWDSPYYFRLLGTKQTHNSETISDFPSPNDGPDGIHRLCTSIHR